MIEIDNNVAELLRLIEKSAQMQVLKKAVFSKSDGGDVLKAVITLKSVAGEDVLQIESFHSDNKAKHKKSNDRKGSYLFSCFYCFTCKINRHCNKNDKSAIDKGKSFRSYSVVRTG